MNAFMPSRKGSSHWEKLQQVIKMIKSLNLDIRGKEEKDFENRISGVLSEHFKEDFIDQKSLKQVMTMVPIFDHQFRPDMSIESNNVAIEVKLLKGTNSFKEALGQSIIYRLGYKYVITVWIDMTKKKTHLKVMSNEKETALLTALEDLNIFVIVK